jgi:hypothetical protein
VLADPTVISPVPQEWHVGPRVHVADTGPARFVDVLDEAFDAERALATVRFIDGFYRAAANDGYEAVLERLVSELRAAGFGGSDARFVLEVLEDEARAPAWTPLSAELVLVVPDEGNDTLHSFSKEDDVDRCMLPVRAPACDVEGDVCLYLEHLKPGDVLVTEVSLTQVLARARARGAAAIVSSSLGTYNVDPGGKERHRDAIQYRMLREDPGLPVMQISQRTHEQIQEACLRSAGGNQSVRLRLRADVRFDERPLRTVVATIEGAKHPEEAVVMCSHVQEPGANDNASGVAGLLESVRVLSGVLRERELVWPARSLVFLWGDELRQTRNWLEHTKKEPVAGLSSDMTGQAAETGAMALLERMPDPGALHTLPPDIHTPWGAGEVTEDQLQPNGLAVIGRCALVDVGLREGERGWRSGDHPWEGGSDHDVLIERGVPAALFWHFTDFTYHTSLDRMAFVDPQEIRRTGVALLATALAVADPRPVDLERYLMSLQLEEDLRVDAAREAKNDELVRMWQQWCRGAREWLRAQCLEGAEPLPGTF